MKRTDIYSKNTSMKKTIEQFFLGNYILIMMNVKI